MRIDRTEIVAGVPILKIRDLLRHASSDEWRVEYVAERLKLSLPKARKVVAELLQRGWIQQTPAPRWNRRLKLYQRTLDGGSLASARAVKPISRAKAEAVLKEFLTRVEEVNARDELSHIVTQVRVFGSYLDKSKPDYGDIDLVIDYAQRDIPGRDIVHYSQERARQSGRHFSSGIEMLFYSEIEVRRLLKGQSRYLSFHHASDLEQTGAQSRVIFPKKQRKKR